MHYEFGLGTGEHPMALAGLVLGTATFGREVNTSDAVDLLDRAFSRGISSIDTAASYSVGEAERLVGRWLRERRLDGHVDVASKLQPPYTASAIERSCDDSLRRLGAESLRIFYFHRWDLSEAAPEALLAMESLRRKGKIQGVGVSNTSLDVLIKLVRCQKELGLETVCAVQNVHNFAVRGLPDSLTRFCRIAGIKTLGYSPIAAGFLTGKHRAAIEEGSRFDVAPAHRDMYFTQQSLKRLELLMRVADTVKTSPATVALAWAFRTPGIDSVIIGARSRKHIDQAVEGRDWDNRIAFDLLELA